MKLKYILNIALFKFIKNCNAINEKWIIIIRYKSNDLIKKYRTKLVLKIFQNMQKIDSIKIFILKIMHK